MTPSASQPDEHVAAAVETAGPNATAAEEARAGGREWMALAALVVPVIMIGVDNTVLNFALPSISESLSPSATQLMWIIDIYGLVLAGLLVTMGSLADRFGRQRMLLVGLTGFSVVSVIAAYADSAGQLIGSRALMGLFGAMLMPSTLALVRNIFVHRDQRRIAIAVWATGFSIGAAAGPMAGGLLLEHFWWGSVLLINVAVIGVLLPFVWYLVPESRDSAPGAVDPISIVLVMSATVPLAYTVKELAADGITVVAVIAAIIAGSSGVAFVRRQLGRRMPLLDVRLFKRPVFAGMVSINLLSILGLVGFTFFASQYLQLVIGLSPLRASLVLVPALIVQAALGLGAVVLVRHVPLNVLAGVGMGAGAVGFGLAALLRTDSPTVMVTVAFALLAGGMGLVQTLASDVIVSSVPPAKAGAASGISETAYELGGAFGPAILGSVLGAVYGADLSIPRGIDPASAQDARETLGGAAHVADELPARLGESLMDHAGAAFTSGVNVASLVGAAVMLGAAALGFVALRDRPEAPARRSRRVS